MRLAMRHLLWIVVVPVSLLGCQGDTRRAAQEQPCLGDLHYPEIPREFRDGLVVKRIVDGEVVTTGVARGMSKADILARLGRPEKIWETDGRSQWYYSVSFGSVTLHFYGEIMGGWGENSGIPGTDTTREPVDPNEGARHER